MDRLINKTVKEIKNLHIQGATNIAKAAIITLGVWSSQTSWTYPDLEKITAWLAFARPTEPLAQNCLYYLLKKAKTQPGISLLPEVDQLIALLQETKTKTVETGLTLLKNGLTILTHCHSSSVTSIFRKAKQKGIKFQVILTETRPRFQGRITAEELIKQGIRATMITDSEAAFIISKEDNVDIDMVIVGADAINTDGSAINKVGSYGISLSAKSAKVPFYVTASLLKYSPFPITIEERSPKEIWKHHLRKLKILNPAFDKIPAANISGYITEVGIVKPQHIAETIKKTYPWIFSQEQKGRIKTWLSLLR